MRKKRGKRGKRREEGGKRGNWGNMKKQKLKKERIVSYFIVYKYNDDRSYLLNTS